MTRPPLTLIRMELKYCEACGALRLRASGTVSPYCVRCERIMSDLAHACQLSNDGRPA